MQPGFCKCSLSDISQILETTPELRGPPGPQGPTGADGTTGTPGKTVSLIRYIIYVTTSKLPSVKLGPCNTILH